MGNLVTVVRVFELADYAVVYWKDNGHYPWVACWTPRYPVDKGNNRPVDWAKMIRANEGREMTISWGQGHYFEKEESAMKWAIEKEGEALEWKIADLREQMEKLDKEIIEMERRTV